MRDDAPPQLVERLDRLGLATRWDFRRVRWRVRRLAREIPLFESVWIDALQQAGVLSPLQGAELNRGRGEELAVGPFVLVARTETHGYGASYRAKEIAARLPVRVTVSSVATDRAEAIREPLARLIEKLAATEIPGIARIERFGLEGERLWTASSWCTARSARDWLVRHGRFAPEQVLEIARQMVRTLAALEAIGELHTDLSASRLLISNQGEALLTEPGLRAILRPEEGYAHADLTPEAYDTLAPERVTSPGPPTTASELYACGALWWHLLTGRPPLAGGNSQTKLRASERARIPDIARLTVDVPKNLTEAVRACLTRDPAARPASFAALAELLGPSPPERKQRFARSIRSRPATPRLLSTELPRAASPARLWGAIAGAVLMMAAATRPWWPAMTDTVMGGSAQARSIERVEPPARPLAKASQEAPAVKIPQAGRSSSPSGSNAQAKMPVLRRADRALTKRSEGTEPASPEPAAIPAGPPPWKVAPDGAFILSSNDAIDAARLGRELRPGTVVRGTPGDRRPRIEIGDAGLTVKVEGVTFEGIDFVWNGTAIPLLDQERPMGMLRLAAYKLSLRDCSFTSAAGEPWVSGILWTGPRTAVSDVTLPTGQISLARCYLRGIGPAIESRNRAALVVDCRESLLVDCGPLVRAAHWPAADEPLAISLSKSTFRENAGLVECRFASVPEKPGRIALETRDAVFAPRPRQALVSLVGPESPAKLLAQLEWTGEGSIVTGDAAVAGWRDEAGRLHPAREDQVRVENLLRGGLGFAGPAAEGPEASRVIRWQAPRRSPDAPGIGDEPLAGP